MNSNENDPKDKNEGAELNRHHKRGRCGGARRLLRLPFIAAVLLIKGAIIMLLWNALIPDLFHGPELFYGQALGLMILAKLLVGFGGGFGFCRGGHRPWEGHRHGGRHPRHPRHRHHHRERWMKMSPEEREKLRTEFRRRFE